MAHFLPPEHVRQVIKLEWPKGYFYLTSILPSSAMRGLGLLPIWTSFWKRCHADSRALLCLVFSALKRFRFSSQITPELKYRGRHEFRKLKFRKFQFSWNFDILFIVLLIHIHGTLNFINSNFDNFFFFGNE